MSEEFAGRKVVRLWKAAWQSNPRLIIVRILQGLFEALLSMADVLGIGVIVDALVTGQNRERVFGIIILYVLIHSVISLIRVLFAWLKDAEERKSTNAVQYRYARQALEVDYAYIQTGRFLNLKKKSMKIMPAFYIHIFGDFVSYLLKFLGIFGIFTVVNPWLIFGIILLSVPSVVLSFRRKKAEYQYKQSITGQERRSDYLYQLMTEYAYAKDIRIYGGEGLISRKYMENAEAQMKKKEKLGRGNAGAASIAYLFYALQLLCMLITFSYMVYRKDISIAEYTVLLSSAMLFVSIITGFFENLAEIRELCKYTKLCEEYDTFIANNSKVVNGGAAASEQKGELWEDRPFSIDFEHVSFQYPGREQMVLEDVSFHIGQREKVSFVGLNGAGKTTVIKLLMRLYEPSQGVIRVNGRDIREIASREYYEKIGIILQDFHIFAYSVRENLCFDKHVELAAMENALQQAGLEERIAKLPKGIETSLYRKLDRDGVELSGGEGQKLAMARALCKNTSLLIMDEPTSALDPLAEYRLFSDMRRISGGNTAIMISHRLSSTKYSDRIFVFEKGRLVQSGSHRELMGTEGLYRELYQVQAKYYQGDGGLYKEEQEEEGEEKENRGECVV